MKALARVRLGRYRPRKAFRTFAAAVVAVLAGVGGSVGLGAIAASNAGAVVLTPVSDLTGNSNAISVQPPYVYAMPENAVAATAAPWTFYVNDNTTGVTPLGNPASVWASGDVMTICVAPPHFAINHVETGNTVTFASTPLVAVAGTSPSTSGVTAPTFTTALTTCPGEVTADSNDAGLKDALTITFTNNPGPTANTQFIIIVGPTGIAGINPVQYNTGPNELAGLITTTGSYLSSSVSTSIIVPANAAIVGALVSANNPPVSLLPNAVNAAISPINITEQLPGTLGSDPIPGDTNPVSQGYICVAPTAGSFAGASSFTVSLSPIGGTAAVNPPVSVVNGSLVAQVLFPSTTDPTVFTFSGITVNAPGFTGNVSAVVTIDQNSSCNNPNAITLVVPGSPVFNYVTIYSVGNPTNTQVTGRISGVTSEGTAVAALQTQYPDNPPFGFCLPNGSHPRPSRFTIGGTIILTTDANDGFDALAASYLASYYDTGVLVTPPGNTVDPLTLQGIRNEGASHIIIVGGNLAVSQADQTMLANTPAYNCGGNGPQLADDGNQIMLSVTRVAGPDVDGTAAAVANFVNSGFVGSLNISGMFGQYNNTLGGDSGSAPNVPMRTAILSTNIDTQDAETASAASYFQNIPILYTGKESLDPETVSALLNLDIQNIIELGGQLALDTPVNAALTGMNINVLRVAGQDGSDTSVQMAKLELNNDANSHGQLKGLQWGAIQGNCNLTIDGEGNHHLTLVNPGVTSADCDVTVGLTRGDYFVDGVTSSVVTGNGPYPILQTESPTVLGQYLTSFFNQAGSPFGIDPVTNVAAAFVPYTGDVIGTIVPFGGPLALAQSTIQAALTAISAGANPV